MTEENKDLQAAGTMPPVPPVPPAEAVAKDQDVAELNVADLSAMKMIIDVASSRGAFKPAEMTVVGQTYTKLSNFLESVSKQQTKGA
jgi:hypothetical protein